MFVVTAAVNLWEAATTNGTFRNFVTLVMFVVVVVTTYQRRIRPVVKAIVRIDAAVPVLLAIADEFKPNSGSTLHDRLVRIEARLDETAEVVESTESTIEAQERMTIRLLVAMADGFRALGHPDVVGNLPSHVDERAKEL